MGDTSHCDEFQDLQWKYKEARIKEFSETFLKQKILPEHRFTGSFSMTPVNSAHLSATLKIPLSNKIYEGSSYFFSRKKILLAHFTNVKAATKIIHESYLRSYCLNCTNDEQELFFASDIFGFKKLDIANARTNYFSNSFTDLFEPEQILNSKLWKEYGDDNKGVALIFSMKSSAVRDWRRFFMSPIQYGVDPIAEMKGLNEKINRWMKEKEFFVRNVPEVFAGILAFHKEVKWKDENEVRLLHYALNRYENHPFIQSSSKEEELGIYRDEKGNCYTKLKFGAARRNNLKKLFRTDPDHNEMMKRHFNTIPELNLEGVIHGSHYGKSSYECLALENVISSYDTTNLFFQSREQYFNLNRTVARRMTKE